jgi:hypothetical protein
MTSSTPTVTGLSPSMVLHSSKLTVTIKPIADKVPHPTLRTLVRFGIELFPVHSPLLRESWLVSFPPLIDMLKFGG